MGNMQRALGGHIRWPVARSPRRDSQPPPPPATTSAGPGSADPATPNRPSTFVGFFSDLSQNPRQAATFVFVVGAIILIASICVMGILFSTAAASKGVGAMKIPLHYILPFGGGASALAMITALVTGWCRRLTKSSPAGEENNDQGK